MLRIENFGGDVAHVALDPDGTWAHSSSPHLLILTDYDEGGNLIGISFAGPLARTVLSEGVPAALDQAQSHEITRPIQNKLDPDGPTIDMSELDAVRSVIDGLLVTA